MFGSDLVESTIATWRIMVTIIERPPSHRSLDSMLWAKEPDPGFGVSSVEQRNHVRLQEALSSDFHHGVYLLHFLSEDLHRNIREFVSRLVDQGRWG